MADEKDTNPQGGEGQSQGDNNGSSQGGGKAEPSVAELLAKVDALEKDNKAYRDKQRKAEVEAQKRQEQQLAEQNEWRTLAEQRKARLDELEAIAGQNEVITTAFNELLERELKEIPEDIRKRVIDPVRAKMSPNEFAVWLRDNRSTFAARQAPGLDGGAGSAATPSVVKLTQSQLEMAKMLNMTPEKYAQRLQEGLAARNMKDDK